MCATVPGAPCRLARRAGYRRSRFVGHSRRTSTRGVACVSSGARQLGAVNREIKKMGCPWRAPLEALSKNYRFFAAFFFAPLAFFAIVLSLELATQPPTNRLAVTTGGLSHPPSYQM